MFPHNDNKTQTGLVHAMPFESVAGHGTVSDSVAPGARLLFSDFNSIGRVPHISPRVLSGIVRLLDVAITFLVSYVIASLYVPDMDPAQHVLYLVASALGGGIAVAIFQAFRVYHVSAFSSIPRQLPRIILAWTIVFGLLAATAFFSKVGDAYSRVWFLAWFVFGVSIILATRVVLANLVRKWTRDGRLTRNVLVIGAGPSAQAFIRQLEETPDTDIRICGVFDDRGNDRVGNAVSGYPKLGSVDDLVTFARERRIDLLVVTLPMTAEDRLLQIFKKLWVLPVDIRLAAHSNNLRFRPRAYSFIGRIPVIDISDRPISDWDFLVKSVFDRTVAALALTALAPVMALAALAIKLNSKGPVLFKQKRYGFNNELVEVFKFRSMYTDMSDVNASKLVTKDDPRVTSVGRFLRKSSIDELPQLFNVLLGELSLVGPRPHALQAKAADELYYDVVDGYFARHKVKPGITGWAQINGWRGETDTQEKIQKRVEHDLYYIENWSIFFDIFILLKTPFSLFRNQNAY